MPVQSPIKGPSGDEIYLLDEQGSSAPDIETGNRRGAQNQTEENDDDSDTDSIIDLSKEKGLKFHLKKKSKNVIYHIIVSYCLVLSDFT